MSNDKEHAWRDRYGPWALVTGASSGIGEAIVRDAARRGLNVVLVARSADRLEALADEVRLLGVEARVVPADLGLDGEMGRVIAETADLDIGLFVPAAGYGTSGSFLDIPLEDELAMVDLNCRAVLAGTRPMAERMVMQGRGGIVLVSSLLGLQGVPGTANYAATKAYVHTLAEGLHAELKARGVDVLALAPAATDTGFAARANMTFAKAESPDVVARAALDALGRRRSIHPGTLARMLAAALAPLGRGARTAMMGKAMKGMIPKR